MNFYQLIIACLVVGIVTIMLVAVNKYGQFGAFHETCVKGVVYLETYHGVSVELDQRQRLVKCQ